MLEIRSFENVFGIKKLVASGLIKNNTIIYAPNGVMKSSLSEGLSLISNGLKPKDVFYNLPCSFNLGYAGQVYTHFSEDIKLPIIVYSDKVTNSDVFERPEISRLVMSKEMREQYLKLIDNSKQSQDRILRLISEKIVGGSKKTDVAEKILKDVFQGANIVDSICCINKSARQMGEGILNIQYNDIFNEKVEVILQNQKFKEHMLNYVTLVNQKFNESIFKEKFSLNELISMYNAAISNGYFHAGHSFMLSNETYNEIKTKELIDQLVNKYYKSNDLKSSFDEVVKLFKNKETKKFGSIIESNRDILTYLLEPSEFKRDFISSIVYSNINDFDELKNALQRVDIDIKELKRKSSEYLTTWNEVLNEYNSFFLNKVFDIHMENASESIVGEALPKFRKVLKGTEVQITNEIEERLSSGERKALLVLNIMFDLKLNLIEKQNVTLVLDDVVESFDYKNKYAIIEYLKIISQNPSVQLIILTHNFDFYRSTRISLSENLHSKLFAYNNNGEVTLYENNQNYYENLSYFNTWKNHGKTRYVISLLPFIRNIEQLKNGAECDRFILLSKYLHYCAETENLDLSQLGEILIEYKFKLPTDLEEHKYIVQLESVCRDILQNTKIEETDLSAKLVLGIGIRVFSDRFMWLKYNEKFGMAPDFDSKKSISRKLFNAIKEFLDNDEASMLNTAMTIAPSFIHVNSFMYEPLIDIGTAKLKETITKLINTK